MSRIDQLREAANRMRGYDLVALHAAGSGHAGGTLSIMDIIEQKGAEAPWGAALTVMLLPLVGGAWYLLARARVMQRSGRVAAVVVGLVVWLIPLCVAIWLVGRPLGPKALT